MSNDKLIEKQALEWSIKLSSDDVDKDVLSAFETWRLADPAHAQAFKNVDRVWLGMSSLTHLKQYATLPAAKPSFIERATHSMEQFFAALLKPTPVAFAAACSVVIALTVVLLPNQETTPNQFIAKTIVAPHGSTQTITLDDGSTLILQPETQIRTAYNDNQRLVYLDSGEVLFSVTRNEQKPFIVYTGQTQTQVLGTVFAVERHNDQVSVAVKEGKVGVSNKNTDSSTPNALLTPGQGVTANTQGDVGKVEAVAIETIASWTNNRLVYQNANLKTIVRDINLYSKDRIIIASSKLEEHELSIAFDVSEIHQMLDNLTEILPVKIDKRLPGTIVISPIEE